MDTSKLDALRSAYKQAIDEWVNAIRSEEALATASHSETTWEHWDTAALAEQSLRSKADDAKDAYKGGLREANFGF